MRLSTRGRYGVKAMCDLAEHYGGGPVGIKTIAQRQQLSEMYLEQLVGVLRKNGLLNSIRGAHGGYELSRSPSEISIGDILRVLEGDMAPSECVHEEHACDNAESCASRRVWVRLYKSITDVMDAMTLQDLLSDDYTEGSDAANAKCLS